MEALILDILLLALVFWAGYNWGKRVAVMRIIASIAEDPEHLGQALDQFRAIRNDNSLEDNPEVDLIVERHGDEIYLYDLANNEFLAQGSSLQEALDRLAERFPDRRYSGHLTQEQADTLGIKG